jgi:23S rRNA pseudouridine2605 synthase
LFLVKVFAKNNKLNYNKIIMRLNRFLAQAGIASRRKCDELILQGKVKVNGKVESRLGRIIDSKTDIISYNDTIVHLSEQFVYLKMNKPKGYICSNSDEKNRKTIFDLIDTKERLFTIGRLDYDTEGLLLLTNDGDLAQKLAHPRNEVDKTYVAKIEGELKESHLAILRKGVVLPEGTMPSAKVEFAGFSKNITKLRITIDEGQNHQIKKMFQGIGKNLIFLKRVSVGGVKLGGLSRGESKPLTSAELNILKTL